jgi:hypothetical protein
VAFLFGQHTRTPNGPQLLDLMVSSSTNGASINIGYGTNAMGANLIWSPGLVEHSVTVTVSSKGGPTTTSKQFLYTASFAAAFSEGPGTIIKVWGDTQVLYDASGAFSNFQGVFDDSIMYAPGQVVKFNDGHTDKFYVCLRSASGLPFPHPNNLFVGGIFWGPYTGAPVTIAGGQQYPPPVMYHGTDDQFPNATIQATLGVHGTSAFRGLVYAVWTDLSLTNFGNRIPSIRGLVQSGTPNAGMRVQLAHAATASGGNTVYTGVAIPGVVDGAWVGLRFTVAGFPANPGNNGANLLCVASTGATPGGTTCTLTLVNASGVNETAPTATATNGGSGTTGLDIIVSDICARSGVSASQVDATDLAVIPVTASDVYQTDGSGIPALTLVAGGQISFYQNQETRPGAPFVFTYPGADGNQPLPSPKSSYTMRPSDTLIFNPYPVTTLISHPGYTSFLPGWTTLDSYRLLPMSIVGVVSGGAGPATWDGTAVAPFVPGNVGSWNQSSWCMTACCLLNVAVAGNYTFKISCKDAILIGIGGGATRISGPMVNSSSHHQTKSAVKGYPIVFAENVGTHDGTHLDGNGELLDMTVSTFVVNFPTAGKYGIELDYGGHNDARTLCLNWMMGSNQSPILPVPGTAGADPVTDTFGFIINSQKDGKSLINDLQNAFFFDSAESDFKLKFIRRGVHASVLTVTESDLGLVEDASKLKETLTQEQEAPQIVSVSYLDPSIDYQQGSQRKQRSSRVVNTKNQKSIDFSLVMTQTMARQIAEKTLYTAWMERQPYEINLWRAFYALLDPTDTIDFVFNGVVYQERLKTVSVGQNFCSALEGVSQLAAAYASAASGGSSLGYITTVKTDGGLSYAALYDIPYLQDGDASLDRLQTGLYWVVLGEDTDWASGVLLQSPTGAVYSTLGEEVLRASFGYATNTLADAPIFYSWDTTSSLNIKMIRGTLAGVTDAAVLAGANAILIGSELVQFVNCVQEIDGSFTISRLLRGRRNTEPFAKGHAAPAGTPLRGELSLVVDGSGVIQRNTFVDSFIGRSEFYKAVTDSGDPTLVTPTSFTSHGSDLKPASPDHITGTRDVSHNLTVGFIRRTRYGGQGLVGPTPLNEDSEAYSLDVLNGVTVVRTIAWTPGTYDVDGNPTIAYSAADQTTDFGVWQPSVSVVVYQLSAQAGRGFPAAAVI